MTVASRHLCSDPVLGVHIALRQYIKVILLANQIYRIA